MDFIQQFVGYKDWIGGNFIQVCAAAGIIFLSLVLRKFLSRKILEYVQSVSKHDHPTFHERFLKTLTQPLSFVFVMLGIYFSLRLFVLPPDLKATLSTSFQAVGTFILFWVIYRLIEPSSFLFYSFSKAFDTDLTEELKSFIVTILKTLVVIVGFLSILQTFGINVAAFLAGLGLVGMAVAFAAQDTIKNLFGSLMIFTDRTFRKGDWIKTPDVEGTVEDIGLRSTVIRQFDKAIVIIPNARLMGAAITNFSRMTQRRITWRFGLTYETSSQQLESIVKNIRQWLEENPDIESDPQKVTTLIHVDQFNTSSIDIFCYFFTKTTNWAQFMAIKEQSILAFKKIIEEEGASFAYPSRTMYVKEDQAKGKGLKIDQLAKRKA